MILYNGDTAVVISVQQMKGLNLLKVSYDEQLELNRVMNTQLDQCASIIKQSDSLISIHNNMVAMMGDRIASHQNIIKQLEVSVTGRDKAIKRLKWHRGVLGVLVVGLITTITISSIN